MSLAIQPLLPVFKRMFFVEIKYHYNNGAKFKLRKINCWKFKQLRIIMLIFCLKLDKKKEKKRGKSLWYATIKTQPLLVNKEPLTISFWKPVFCVIHLIRWCVKHRTLKFELLFIFLIGPHSIWVRLFLFTNWFHNLNPCTLDTSQDFLIA